MKATLEFNLPEDRNEHARAVRGSAYYVALCDIDALCRGILKGYHDHKTVEDLAQTIRRDYIAGLTNDDDVC